ncbi:unnamed protein product [Cuscuta epithymum]|uniref:CCHC-type domain-containing protein n=1 Tax=Cuscuta epithymum TaxID=186058 RepID=A0AAV0F4C9_9ASTE|nr:unnamed protein product [Cuscuta epithymum]
MAEGEDSLQSISVRLDGTNYTYWSFGMKNFLKGKKMWKYVSGAATIPTKSVDGEKFDELLDVWDTNNSKIITWINNSVEHRIGMQLAKYDTAKQVWDYLQKLYVRSNFAVQYQLEADIRALVQTEDMGIEEFYNKMTMLWDQLAATESAELRAFAPYIARREEQRLVQFLMALRSEFELMRGSILHRTPLPSVDSVVHELLAEETRLKTHTSKAAHASTPSVFAVPQSADSSAMAVRTQRFSQNRHMTTQECAYCKEQGHWKNQCPKLLERNRQTGQPRGGRAPQSQYRSGSRRGHFSGGGPHYNFRPTTTTFVPYSDQSPKEEHVSPETSLADQFQKFLAAQTTPQSHAMSASSSGASGSEIQGEDWDRP